MTQPPTKAEAKELTERFRKATVVGYYHGGYVGKQLSIDILKVLEALSEASPSASEVLEELKRTLQSWKFPPDDLVGRKGLNLMKLIIHNNAYDIVLNEIDAVLTKTQKAKPEAHDR